ncbi:MAG: ATP-dependent helicase [Candidatus Thermoplasmatota archaeon]|nr:ATP-dependent helicase [Candidatus Thermoplasmatota archaeon]
MTEKNPTDEQKRAINNAGNTLILANPGTGKTYTLGQKFMELIRGGVKPSEILCITFTNKARDKMEEEIIHELKESRFNFSRSELNIHTFHSFANKHLGEKEIVDPNLLRYVIFRYLKDNHVLNYEDEYLINEIVPRIENDIRKLKSFGITPDRIDLEAAKANIPENINDSTANRAELSFFIEKFVDIFKTYENIKGKRLDYSDLLIRFLDMKEKPVYKHVLVDELQDMNRLEAEIARSCSRSFFVVGDRKQAIFGFQGGSVSNFEKFSDGEEFILSINHRSTNEILGYAADYLTRMTGITEYQKELQNLSNPHAEPAPKVTVIKSAEKDSIDLLYDILSIPDVKSSRELAILARKNDTVRAICRSLDDMGVAYQTTLSTHSDLARKAVIGFISGLISDNTVFIPECILSPFFPSDLRKISEFYEKRRYGTLTFQDIEKAFPAFGKLREKCQSLHSLLDIFDKNIIPQSIALGREYLNTAISFRSSAEFALENIQNLSPQGFLDFMNICNFEDREAGNANIIVSSVHKAKGLEFDTVIYFPAKERTQRNVTLQEVPGEAILASQGINVRDEIGKEPYRIDFVAFTRAMRKLYVVAFETEPYECKNSETVSIQMTSRERFQKEEHYARAYAMFLAGDLEGCRALIDRNDSWLLDRIRDHFSTLKHLSFSSLKDKKPMEYLRYNILGISSQSRAMVRGTAVHAIAEAISKGEQVEIDPDMIGYAENIKSILERLKNSYPTVLGSEISMVFPMNEVFEIADNLNFKGKADLVLTNGDKYLVLDWKTSKKENSTTNSEYNIQLESYRRLLAKHLSVNLDQIEAAVGYVALRRSINASEKFEHKIVFETNYDKQFSALKKKIDVILGWRHDPDSFVRDLIGEKGNDPLQKEILGEITREMNYKPASTRKGAIQGILDVG